MTRSRGSHRGRACDTLKPGRTTDRREGEVIWMNLMICSNPRTLCGYPIPTKGKGKGYGIVHTVKMGRTSQKLARLSVRIKPITLARLKLYTEDAFLCFPSIDLATDRGSA